MKIAAIQSFGNRYENQPTQQTSPDKTSFGAAKLKSGTVKSLVDGGIIS